MYWNNLALVATICVNCSSIFDSTYETSDQTGRMRWKIGENEKENHLSGRRRVVHQGDRRGERQVDVGLDFGQIVGERARRQVRGVRMGGGESLAFRLVPAPSQPDDGEGHDADEAGADAHGQVERETLLVLWKREIGQTV